MIASSYLGQAYLGGIPLLAPSYLSGRGSFSIIGYGTILSSLAPSDFLFMFDVSPIVSQRFSHTVKVVETTRRRTAFDRSKARAV